MLCYYLLIFLNVYFPPFDSLIHKINFYCMLSYYRLNQQILLVLVHYTWHCIDMDHNIELYQVLFSCMTFLFCYEGKSSKLVLTLNKKYNSNRLILVLITHQLIFGPFRCFIIYSVQTLFYLNLNLLSMYNVYYTQSKIHYICNISYFLPL